MRVLKALLCIVLFSTVSAFGQTGAQVSSSGNEFGSLWFVELARAPLADVDAAFTVQQRLNYLAQLRADKQAFRDAAVAARIAYRERRAFDLLWNGLAIEVNPADLPRVARLAGVSRLYPILTYSIPQVQPASQPDLATALAMTGADVAQSELGYTGAGIRVAVMDTGIDYHHPDLGGCFGPGCRVEVGHDFVGDAFNFSDPSVPISPTPVPDPDPDDCNGHGTHVAGIIGANGTVKGVAPGVTFGAYRVFGCNGNTSADIMLAAMERILADGAHILNMSIGSAFQWPQYPTGQASDRLVNKGIVVVASIGNSGANGLYSTSAPGNGSKVIGVASFDNSHISALTFTVNPSGRQVPYLPLATTPDPPTSGTTPQVVFVGRGCSTGSGVPAGGDPYLADPAGKVALIERGVCTFNEKYNRAADAGAVGVIIHNNVSGLFAGGGVASRGIFGVGISQADGLHIRSLLSAGQMVTVTWSDVRVNAPNPTGGLISSFSSYGLSPDLSLKPDIGAPGGLIRSTYPLELGRYATVSGTSMSAPHVAGAVALLLEAHPRTPAQAIRDILQNSADPKLWWGNPGLGFLDNVHRQGAGMLDIDDAIRAQSRVRPGKLALGESPGGSAVTRTLTIENNAAASVTYDLSHAPALSTGANTFVVGFFTGFAAVAFSTPSVAVPARSSVTFDVTITPNPALAERGQYGGYIVLTPRGGGPPLRVPYAGFKGDYQSIVALTPTPFGFPWLAKLVGSSFQRQPPEATFTFAPNDVMYVLLHLDHQVRRLRAEVFDTAGRSFQRAFEFQYVGRNSTATGFFAIPWDGRTTRGTRVADVPNGSYVIRLSVQKALGEDDDPAHWESWTSPVFRIARPAGGSSP